MRDEGIVHVRQGPVCYLALKFLEFAFFAPGDFRNLVLFSSVGGSLQ